MSFIGKTYMPMISLVISTIFHFFWCVIFVTIFGFAVKGVAIATTITNISNYIILNLMV
jgi:Na+-driven multidrug efflux pump